MNRPMPSSSGLSGPRPGQPPGPQPAASPGLTRLTHVTVVVPARNEERLLPHCLAALGAAARAAATAGLCVRILVVLDRCTDGTADVAQRLAADTLVVAHGAVGAARAAGATEAVRAWAVAGVRPEAAWLACTDADSTVPPAWLVRQAELADDGADCVVGTVEPMGVTEALAAAWHRRHRLTEGHAHVHGANLGVRASAYLDVGGFGGLRVHEDVALVARLRRAGHCCVATDRTRVATSGRLRSRVEDGFAAYLTRLSGPVPPAVLTAPAPTPGLP